MFTKEALGEVNKSLSTIGISKKDKTGNVKTTQYAMVTERIKGFRTICPAGSITTEIISLVDGVVTMKATITDETGKVIATGLAQEKETSSFINKTSFIENCETSAVGRALGFAGIGIDGSMASAEEVANAIMNQNTDRKADKPQTTAGQNRTEPDRTGQAAYPPVEQMVSDITEKMNGNKTLTEWVNNALAASNARDLSEMAFINENAIKAWWNKLYNKG